MPNTAWAVTLMLVTTPAPAETMRASFYGAKSGSWSADGSRFAPMSLTVAHRSLLLGSRREVCLRRCVVRDER